MSPSPESFEAAYRELQEVVAQLEHGDLDLERAVQLFERGSVLAQTCERIVNAAELRVTRLVAELALAVSDVPAES
ncbi:MAG: exodeoxyribonuclease VII small subunit [Chloroflexota bacterium]|nr:exodeoxyribonuclease VII small subunit [Chloroflexota bacterium]